MKELTAEVKQQLLAPFQAAEIRVRTQPYVAAYITSRVAATRLDEVLPFQWSFKLKGSGVIDANGVMHQDGVLLLRHPDGSVDEHHDRGSAPPDMGKGQAKQAKHAVSDCFKRCASQVGVARYLYELVGVQGGKVPKGALEKALAAVGYHGPWDDRHHGVIGGIREADMEDEEQDGAPPPEPAAPQAPANRTRPNIKATEEHKARIREAVERGGGNAQAPTFLGWLTKNTANNAVTLDDVLAEDVEDIVRKLDDLAGKRKAGAQ